MKPASEDIKDMLVAGGIGVFGAASGWSINIGVEPSKPNAPDTTLTIYDTGGSLLYTMTNTDNPVMYNTFQLRVRANGYVAGYQKLLAASKVLENQTTYVNDDDTYDVSYYTIKRTTDIMSLGEDDNDRKIWVTNFQTTRRESNS